MSSPPSDIYTYTLAIRVKEEIQVGMQETNPKRIKPLI